LLGGLCGASEEHPREIDEQLLHCFRWQACAGNGFVTITTGNVDDGMQRMVADVVIWDYHEKLMVLARAPHCHTTQNCTTLYVAQFNALRQYKRRPAVHVTDTWASGQICPNWNNRWWSLRLPRQLHVRRRRWRLFWKPRRRRLLPQFIHPWSMRRRLQKRSWRWWLLLR
jgi:hypothetical protein